MASCSTGDRCGSAGGFPSICTWINFCCILIYDGRRKFCTCHGCKACLGSLAVARRPGTNGLSTLHRRQLMTISIY